VDDSDIFHLKFLCNAFVFAELSAEYLRLKKRKAVNECVFEHGFLFWGLRLWAGVASRGWLGGVYERGVPEESVVRGLMFVFKSYQKRGLMYSSLKEI